MCITSILLQLVHINYWHWLYMYLPWKALTGHQNYCTWSRKVSSWSMRQSKNRNHAIYVFKHVFLFYQSQWVGILVWPVSRNGYVSFLIRAQDCVHFSDTSPPPSPLPPAFLDLWFLILCVLYYMNMILKIIVIPISTGWEMSSNKCAGLGAAFHKIVVLFWFLNEDINNWCMIGWDWSN